MIEGERSTCGALHHGRLPWSVTNGKQWRISWGLRKKKHLLLWSVGSRRTFLLLYRCLVSLISKRCASWQHQLAESERWGRNRPAGNGERAVTRTGSVDVFNVSHGHRTDTSHCRSNRACWRPAGTRRERLQLRQAYLIRSQQQRAQQAANALS
jgi:hypothetical protein